MVIAGTTLFFFLCSFILAAQAQIATDAPCVTSCANEAAAASGCNGL
jgi:hypothetical protein